MRTKIEIGKSGEEKAVMYLKEHGYRILARNFRTRSGEIDIVACEKGVVCFVEVRSRSGEDRKEEALASIGRLKQYRLSRLAASYLKKNGLWGKARARFDVVCVLKAGPADHVYLLKDAFPACERYS